MKLPVFFEQIMGIREPWYIKEINVEGMEVNIQIDFKKGSKFEYLGEYCSVHDTIERQWRHLNLFQYKAYIRARVPRIKTKDGVKTIEVPWANPGSGFTMLFEVFVLQMAMSMSISEVAKIMDETENRIWRIAKHYTDKELDAQDFSKEPIRTLAMDEVARRKGHDYITNFVDVDTRKVVFVARGKSADTIRQFKEAYLRKGGKESDIKTPIMDMSPAFIKGAKNEFPKAQIVFDKFHVMKILNEQLDNVRRREQKQFDSFFKKTRYLFLKSEKNLNSKQKKKLAMLLEDESKDTVKAYNLIQSFRELFTYKRPSAAGRFLTSWIQLCKTSKIPEMMAAAETVLNHIEGILQHIRTQKTNALLEGLNSKLRVLTKRAFGFKSFDYLKTTIFMCLGKLDFSFEPSY